MASGNDKYDIAVIGSGPGGYVAALRAAQLGLRTAIVEQLHIGGTCLNRGCIPSKALLHSVHVLDTCERASRFGVDVNGFSLNLENLHRHRDRCVKQLVSGVEILLDKAGVDVLWGHGSFVSDHEIAVKGDDTDAVIEADTIIIATGSLPSLPPIEGIGSAGVWTSDDALAVRQVPESMAIIGSGATGMEMACVYTHLGTKVTILEMFDHALPREDRDAAEVVARTFQRRGGRIEVNARVVRIQHAGTGKRVIFERDGEEQAVEAEVVLSAAGRRANLEGLGAEEIGLEVAPQGICVREGVDTPAASGPPQAMCPGTRLRTSLDHIYAIGDCIRGIGLAHLAMHEGVAAVEDSQGLPATIDYHAVPTAMYCHPEIASVGMMEYQAQERGVDYIVGRFPFAANGRSVAIGSREGFAKIVADRSSHQVLGATIVGRLTTELISEVTLAVRLGATVDDLIHTIHAHPTFSEVVHEAALGALGIPLHIPAD